MPDLGAVDPADLRVQARAELGLSRELAQSRRVAPHPRRGGSSGYPVWSREEIMEKWNAGGETVASEATLYRWSDRLIPHRCTGNHARTQIVGTGLINLVVLLFTHPNANFDEMAAHIYNEGGGGVLKSTNLQAPQGAGYHEEDCFSRGLSGPNRGGAALRLLLLEPSSPPWHLSGAPEDAH